MLLHVGICYIYLLVILMCTQSSPTLCDPMDYRVHQAPLSMESSRQEYWNRLPFLPPGNLPHPGMELLSPVSPALQADSLPAVHSGFIFI